MEVNLRGQSLAVEVFESHTVLSNTIHPLHEGGSCNEARLVPDYFCDLMSKLGMVRHRAKHLNVQGVDSQGMLLRAGDLAPHPRRL